MFHGLLPRHPRPLGLYHQPAIRLAILPTGDCPRPCCLRVPPRKRQRHFPDLHPRRIGGHGDPRTGLCLRTNAGGDASSKVSGRAVRSRQRGHDGHRFQRDCSHRAGVRSEKGQRAGRVHGQQRGHRSLRAGEHAGPLLARPLDGRRQHAGQVVAYRPVTAKRASARRRREQGVVGVAGDGGLYRPQRGCR